ncbi:MAG: hypothetical protein QT11_C0001G0173 [archaeon GW2011_AR20]|nr:MAG: hypothetical protein QT11_C0001G0173 [archaeon GW2011_AR20]MBS3160660.1 hypothetical protein [Candidatus Woesearchaeota archaeon]
MEDKYYVTPPGSVKIKWGGPTDLKELYRQMKIWLEDNGFATEESLEKRYVEAIKPNGKDLYIYWEGEKKISDYFTNKINVEFSFVAMQDVEVQEGNIKRKLSKGTLEIRITAYVEYGKKWESVGALSKFYYKMISKQRLEEHAKDFYNKVYKFHTLIKDFIGLTN